MSPRALWLLPGTIQTAKKDREGETLALGRYSVALVAEVVVEVENK